MKSIAIKSLALLAFAGTAMTALAQKEVTIDQGTISIASRGRDVREILHDLFLQAGKNYVVDHNVRGTLFLALRGMDFDEVLGIICKQNNLDYSVRNDIYFFTQKGTASTPTQSPSGTKSGRLDTAVLKKTVNTNFLRTDLREVAKELGKQAGIVITIHESVPKYALDLVLKKSSLGYGLKMVTEALALQTVFTDSGTITLVPAAKTAKH